MIWFVGRSYKEHRDYFNKHGIKYGLFSDIHRRDIPSDKSVPRIEVDFTSEKTIIDSLPKKLPALRGLISIYETYVYGQSIMANHFELPGMPKDAALACTDKALMRQKFLAHNPSITPDYQTVDSFEDAKIFMAQHRYPVILKPANLVKSLLVTKNQTPGELEKNYRFACDTIHHLYQKHSIKREPKLLIEEFLEGSVHSVDAFVDVYGNPCVLDQIVDYETGYDLGRSENYHFSRRLPSKLSKIQQADVRRVATEGIKALDMRSSPAHVEIILASSGPKIVEIGARTGGYRTQMHNYANGIDMIDALIRTATGKTVKIKTLSNKFCAVIEIFPDKAGRFEKVSNLDKLLELPTLIRHRVLPKQGTHIGLSSQGHKASVIVVLGSNDRLQFENDYAYVKDKVEVVTT